MDDRFELTGGRIHRRRKVYKVVRRSLFNTLTGSGPRLIKAPGSSVGEHHVVWLSVFRLEIVQTIGNARANES